MSNLTRYLDVIFAAIAAFLSLANFAIRRGMQGWLRVGKWLFAILTVLFGMHAAAVYIGNQGETYRIMTEACRALIVPWNAVEILFYLNGKQQSQRATAGQAYD